MLDELDELIQACKQGAPPMAVIGLCARMVHQPAEARLLAARLLYALGLGAAPDDDPEFLRQFLAHMKEGF